MGINHSKQHLACIFIFLLLFSLLFPAVSYANMGLVLRGLARTVTAAFEVPTQMLQGSTHAFPLGLVTGAVSGTMRTVAGTLLGAADMARGAAPYAKYMIFMI